MGHGIDDIDDGNCTAGLPPKWWWDWIPDWMWRVKATWENGKLTARQCDYDKCPDADIHREIYMSLIWLDKDRLTRAEKIDLMHTIREKLKLPDMRRVPRHLPYVGPEE
jgi:hypothetical protein